MLIAAACNKQAAVQPAENQQETQQTSNWKTYTNSQMGFELSYPSSWAYLSAENNDVDSLEYLHAKDINSDFSLLFAYKSYEGLIFEKQNTSVFEGQPAKYNIYGYAENLTGPAVIDKNNPKRLASYKLNATQANKLRISGYSPGQDAFVSDGEGAFVQMEFNKADEEEAIAIFNHVLSTFKFTK